MDMGFSILPSQGYLAEGVTNSESFLLIQTETFGFGKPSKVSTNIQKTKIEINCSNMEMTKDHPKNYTVNDYL